VRQDEEEQGELEMSGLKSVRFVKASAGSGKTYSVTTSIAKEVKEKKYGADQVLATTFTVKAANDLESRIRAKLLEDDTLVEEASKVRDALIGTVNSVCGRLLSEQAIAVGESPNMAVLPDESGDMIFNQAISSVLTRHTAQMNEQAERLSIQNWPKIVRLIIECARTSGIGANELKVSKAYSIEQAKRVYVGGAHVVPAMYQEALDRSREVIEVIVKAGESAAAAVKGATFWRWCEILSHVTVRTWKDVKALKVPSWPAKKEAQRFFASLRPLYDQLTSLDVLKSNELQKEVTDFIERVFDVAAEAMNEYAHYKTEYGLVDFVDQEIKVLEFLDKSEEFREGLRSRVKAMYVDEFQDTNPVQLAVYLKLAETIDGKTTWVGDPKQAIYRFRGADYAFMAKVMDAIDSNTEPLQHSWRSRRLLVDFASEVFAKVFPDLEAKNEVRLGIADSEKEKDTRIGGKIAVWQIESRAQTGYATGLANRIAKGFRDGEWKHYGDVAVLLHDNKECGLLAEELQKRGIPTSIGGTKLRDDLIANLAMCAYRYVYSVNDTIAKAVLEAYRPDVKPDEIDDPNALEAYTPLELFEKAVADWRIDDYVRGTDAPERGLATIEALRQLYRDYEGMCKVRGVSATHAGFIRHFMNTQASGASAAGCDCVQIHTYHGSKGLEWDTVILGSLNEEPDGSPFGVKGVQSGEIDVEKPLANRVVRYIPTPFGDRRSDECGPFKDRGIAGYDEMSSVELEADAEEMRRLMYVGVTRAKSEVIFAPQLKVNYSKTNPTQVSSKTLQVKWMEHLTPDVPFSALLNTLAEKWTIGNKSFDVSMENVPDGELVSVDCRRGLTDKAVTCPGYQKAKVSPSSLAEAATTGVAGRQCPLSGKLEVLKERYSADLGECFHSYAAVAVPGKDDVELAKSLICRWGIDGTVSAEAIVAAGRRLREWIVDNLNPKSIHTEIPMRFNHPNGQASEGFIDMLVEKADGSFVVVDHKVISDHHAETCVKTYAAQQEVYRQAVQADCARVSQIYLHLPAQGRLVEVVYPES